MMVALAMIIFLKYYTLVSSYILIIAAFIGSMLQLDLSCFLQEKSGIWQLFWLAES